MITTIKLCSMPFLDLDYQNVIDFDSPKSMRAFFSNQIKLEIEGNIKVDGECGVITVKKSIDDLLRLDYLLFSSKDKNYYYFITNKKMVNDNITELYVQLDIWTTYLFCYDIMDSFVDRCHVPRWYDNYPTDNNVDEGLDFGDIIQLGNAETIAKFNDSIVITSTVPLGKLPTAGEGGHGGIVDPSDDNGSWKDGKLSAKGFRFIKGFEGYAPNAYQDSSGYWTICYGVTKHGEEDIYKSLVAKQPVPEEEGAKVSYKLKNERYGAKILSAVKSMGITKQCQFDALVSIAYNAGTGVVTGNNRLTQIIEKDPNNESAIRPVWENFAITSDGQVLNGLIARRKQECNMYFGKPVEMRPIEIIGGRGTVTENNGNGWLPSITSSSNNGSIDGHIVADNDFGKGWLCPVKGAIVTSVYGNRNDPIHGGDEFHKGTDLGCPTGTPTLCGKDGIVQLIGWENESNHKQGFGQRVWISSGDIWHVYPHLSKIENLAVGQQVKRGQKIGEVGTTGSSTGSHFHWQLSKGSPQGQTTNPDPKLKEGDRV